MDRFSRIAGLWQSYQISSPSDIDRYLDNFRILFAYHSGKIENADITYNDTREIFENDRVVGFTGNTRAIFEQQNQKLCYEALKPKIAGQEPLSTRLIKDIHRILTSGTYDERRYIDNEERPGEYKKHDYVTGIHQVGSAAEDVEKDLAEIIEEVSSYEVKDILKAACYFHARFEFIHPFADGNGRVGRTLMNYYLMVHGCPPVIVYEEDKKLYYECLQTYDESEDIGPLYAFLKYETEKTWGKALDLADGNAPVHRNLSDS